MIDGDLDFPERLADNLKRMQSESGKVVVTDGKRIGPGKNSSSNQIVGNTVSKTAEEAAAQANYEESVLGQLNVESLSDKEIDDLADKYVDKLVDELFENL